MFSVQAHQNSKPSTFHIVNVIWGKVFSDSFVSLSLPLQLGPDNFGVFPPGSARYKLFTTLEDWQYMQ